MKTSALPVAVSLVAQRNCDKTDAEACASLLSGFGHGPVVRLTEEEVRALLLGLLSSRDGLDMHWM